MTIIQAQDKAHMTAKAKGFWPSEYYNSEGKVTILAQLAKLALITEEIGEAVSAVRKPGENNLAEEIADIIIRAMDLAGGLGFDLAMAIERKMDVNRLRPFRHDKLA